MGRSMNTAYRQNVIKIVQCGRVALQALLVQQVQKEKPTDHDEEWTLDHFLHDHRVRVESEIGAARKLKILFPGFGKKTKVEDWDLQMLCFVLTKLCVLDRDLETHVQNLRDLRNVLVNEDTSRRPQNAGEGVDIVRAQRLKELLDSFKSCISNANERSAIDNLDRDIDNMAEGKDSDCYMTARLQLESWYDTDQDRYEMFNELRHGNAAIKVCFIDLIRAAH